MYHLVGGHCFMMLELLYGHIYLCISLCIRARTSPLDTVCVGFRAALIPKGALELN